MSTNKNEKTKEHPIVELKPIQCEYCKGTIDDCKYKKEKNLGDMIGYICTHKMSPLGYKKIE